MISPSETPAELPQHESNLDDNKSVLNVEEASVNSPVPISSQDPESNLPNLEKESTASTTAEVINPPPTQQEPAPPPDSQGSYAEKTDRLRVIIQLLNALKPFIWAFIIFFIFLPLLGRVITGFSLPSQSSTVRGGDASKPPIAVVEPAPKLSKLDQAVADAIQASRQSAQDYAKGELNVWGEELVPRVDNFLDWYFDYFNQKRMEFTVPFTYAKAAIYHFFQKNSPGPGDAVAENLTAEFQREFAKQVLVPRTAQLRFENITKDTVDRFLTELSKNVNAVRKEYQVPQAQWNRYLNDIATTINDTEGNVSNLSLKVLVGGGSYLAAKPLIIVAVGKIGSKVTAKVASKAAAKVAVKTGSAVAAELGTSLIDPLVGVGLLLWDIWDYKRTVAADRPILRENLLAYLQDVKRSLLTASDTGIMSVINQVEAKLVSSLNEHSAKTT